MSVPDGFLEDLWHRSEIEAAMRRYCRGLDRRDWDLLRSAYHPDAHDDHGTYKGGVDGLVTWAAERHAHSEQSIHLLGHCTIDRVGDVAVVETYCIAHLRFDPAAGAASAMYAADESSPPLVSATWWLRYVDRFERRPDWRVADRVVVLEHVETAAAEPALADDTWTRSRRDRDDTLWARLRTGHDAS